jgi:uncharacterized protein YigA (DUF484 family)
MSLESTTVAAYLAGHPDFFEEHTELLSAVRLSSGLSGRAVSLQERQMEVMREKYKQLELKMAALMRNGHQNDGIAEKFHQWTCSLLASRHDTELPRILVDGLRNRFDVPQATLRLWGVGADHADAWFARPVSGDIRIFANGLDAPFCGPNNEFEAAGWLDDAAAVKSIAMLPLRVPGAQQTFGMLVLGSPDAQRFSETMSTDFLIRFAATASAALASLLD